MFTGIVSDVGRVKAKVPRGDLRLEIETGFDMTGVAIGASICVSGVCLTVVAKGPGAEGRHWFAADVSAETLDKTTIGGLTVGARVNLERSLRLGDEMGGHLVSGHVDGVADLIRVVPEGDSLRLWLRAPHDLARFIAPKGSVALDGTSLTVNEVDGDHFGINIIPHTRLVTTWSERHAGDRVNLEIDLLARYVARLNAWTPA